MILLLWFFLSKLCYLALYFQSFTLNPLCISQKNLFPRKRKRKLDHSKTGEKIEEATKDDIAESTHNDDVQERVRLIK